MRMKTLNEAFTNYIESGIFHYLAEYNVPWDMQPEWLDLDYHANHSGRKTISPLVDSLLIGTELTISDRETLAGVIFGMYGGQWTRRWNVLTSTYNPIENYNMVENENTEASASSSQSSTGRVEHDGSDSTSGNALNKIYGFNATSGSNADETSTSNTTTYDTSDSSTQSASDSSNQSADRLLTRSGNIGVTTTQQMIESELQLRKHNFYADVFADIDKILTTGVYAL